LWFTLVIREKEFAMARPKVEITDEQWKRIRPLLPKTRGRPGRPRADDRLVLEGIIWVLRSGARWRDLPERYPSPSTCWRRLQQWEDEGVWEDIWRAFLTELDEQGRIDWDEFFADAAFVPAKKGGPESAQPSGARVQSWWWWRAARVFLAEFTWTRPRRRK
jgi:transposase